MNGKSGGLATAYPRRIAPLTIRRLGRGTTRDEIDAVVERLGRLPATGTIAMASDKPVA